MRIFCPAILPATCVVPPRNTKFAQRGAVGSELVGHNGGGGNALPLQEENQIEAFVANYNHRRYHESIDDLTPADVYFGRGQTILPERERIKRKTIQNRRLLHRRQAA